MYQAFATLALLLIILRYWYCCYGDCLGFIISKEIKITQKHDTQFGHTVNV